jgi:transposase InsO family protein
VETPTWDDKKYMLTLLDVYTHFTVIYLLKNKYEVTDTIKEYAERVEAKWNLKIAKLRSDNGREYLNNNMQEWCKRKEIEMNLTVPYTPQLNGKAERLNHTLMEKIRALIGKSALKKEMWGEAAYTAAYLLNRSLTKTLTTTPYEKWNGRKPDLSNLRLFGNTAYSKILGPLKKLEDRSKKFIFVGYAPNGYRLWKKEK